MELNFEQSRRLDILFPPSIMLRVLFEDPAAIETTAWMQEVEQRREQLPKILTHLNIKAAVAKPARLPESRVLPQAVLCDGP